jgi:peptidyl-prolyl cis-trans isomerase SDCCAG10
MVPNTDRADELHGKHTLFGRCVGDTIFSTCALRALSFSTSHLRSDVLKIGELGNARLKHSTPYSHEPVSLSLEIDKNGRPLYPPKIKSVRIIDNPYDDIMPRITAEEKRVQARAKEDAQRERDETARRKGAKK